MLPLDRTGAVEQIAGVAHMGITADGWLDWATREPGPADKVYSEVNKSRGLIPHSIVGTYQNARGRLMSQERDRDGRYTDAAAASWTGTVRKSGLVIQHYPFSASTWTSGSRIPNCTFNAFETEGGPPGNESEPWTPEQLASWLRIMREHSAHFGYVPRRPATIYDQAATLYLHRECKRWGSAATACDSGRAPWGIIMPALATPAPVPEEDMKPYLAWCPDFLGGSIWFIGPQGARWIKDGAVVDELAREFGPMTKALKAKVITAIGVVP